MKYKDYYAALGVPPDADVETIRKAYRKLARQHHPDVSGKAGTEERFKEVAEAYATLKDPEKRAAYDRLGRMREGEEFRPPPDWQQATAGAEDLFAGVDLADLLASLQARQHRGRASAPAPGRDVEASLQLSLEDAHRGTTVSLDIAHPDGSRTLAVTIPPGTTDGQVLRLRGKGAPGQRGAPAGDIYLHIVLLPHRVFRTDGHDLYFDLPLAPWEAALGAEVEVPTLDGPVMLSVPPGSSSGRKLRMRGRGLATGHGGRGDLYALLRLEVPAKLTPQERDLYEALARASAFNPRAVAGKEPTHAS